MESGTTPGRGRRLLRLLPLAAVLLGFGVASAVTAATQSGGPAPPLRAATAAPRPPAPVVLPPRIARRRARQNQTVAVQIARVRRRTSLVKSGGTRHRLIALTFDDGPGPFTQPLIAELVRLHVPATFFVVGQQLVNYSHVLREELLRGFIVGDHTENHRWMVTLSPAAQLSQIRDARLRMRYLRAPRPVLFRPPYGALNAATLAAARQEKMLTVLWSVDTRDWTRPGTDRIVYNALSGAKPGAILLMHDAGGDRAQTVAALPRIVSALRRRGFQLVTVPTLLTRNPPPAHQRFGGLEGVPSVAHATRQVHRSRTR